MDDSQAIRLLREGDIAGLEVLVQRYQERAVHAAYLICLDVEMAQDAAQEAFLRVYRRSEQFELGRPFAPWFLRIVANETLMALRKRKRLLPLVGEAAETSLPDLSPSIEATLLTAESHAALRQALAMLSPKQRAAVVYRYYLGLSEAQMADLLGCPRGTVKRRLYDARQRLRQILSDCAGTIIW